MDAIIEKDWAENYGRAWVELLESGVTEHAKICYVAMTSFGPGACRAGMKKIAQRMGVKSRNTVRAAQAELQLTGWATLLAAETKTTPARWRMNQQPVKQAVSRGDKGEGHDITLGGSPDTPGEGHDVTPKQEDKQEVKQEGEAAGAATRPEAQPQKQDLDQDTPSVGAAKPAKKADAAKEARGRLLAAFVRWWLNQPDHAGLKYPDHAGDKAGAERLMVAGVTAEDMPKLLAAWPSVADQYTKDNAFAFRVFCSSFLKIQAAAAKASPVLRACTHPVDKYVVARSYGEGPDGYDAQTGTCTACGRSVARYKGGRVEG